MVALLLLGWVGDDDSGPQDVRMMWILSALHPV
jgi:hypothetical protein